MTIKEYLKKKGECVVCYASIPGRWVCEEHQFHPDLLDCILNVEIDTSLLSESRDKQKSETQYKLKMK